jgi:hypothetical protein
MARKKSESNKEKEDEVLIQSEILLSPEEVELDKIVQETQDVNQTIEELVKDVNVYVVEDIRMKDNVSSTMTVDNDVKKPQVSEEVKNNTDNNQYSAVISVKVNFPDVGARVTAISQATGQSDELIAANGRLKLISGRFYYVPVEPVVNSDEFEHMKIMSKIADKIDVKFVKDGLACIMPLQNGIDLMQGTDLCILW